MLKLGRYPPKKIQSSHLNHACFDYLSRETYAKQSVWAKAFRPSIVVTCTFGYYLFNYLIKIGWLTVGSTSLSVAHVMRVYVALASKCSYCVSANCICVAVMSVE